MKILKIEIDEKFHQTLKVNAAREGKSLQDYAIDLLRYMLRYQ